MSGIKTYILVEHERYQQLEDKNNQLRLLSQKYSELEEKLREAEESKNTSRIQKDAPSSAPKRKKQIEQERPHDSQDNEANSSPIHISSDQNVESGGGNRSESNLKDKQFIESTISEKKAEMPPNWWSIL